MAESTDGICAIWGVVGGSVRCIGMAQTAVFTERLEVRLRTDQKEQLAIIADALHCDTAALVRLAIDNMFEDMEDIKRRDARWQKRLVVGS